METYKVKGIVTGKTILFGVFHNFDKAIKLAYEKVNKNIHIWIKDTNENSYIIDKKFDWETKNS